MCASPTSEEGPLTNTASLSRPPGSALSPTDNAVSFMRLKHLASMVRELSARMARAMETQMAAVAVSKLQTDGGRRGAAATLGPADV